MSWRKTAVIVGAFILVLVGVSLFILVPLAQPTQSTLELQLYNGSTPVGEPYRLSSIPLTFIPGAFMLGDSPVTHVEVKFAWMTDNPHVDSVAWTLKGEILWIEGEIDQPTTKTHAFTFGSGTGTLADLNIDSMRGDDVTVRREIGNCVPADLPEGRTFQFRVKGICQFKDATDIHGTAETAWATVTISQGEPGAGYDYSASIITTTT